MKKNLSSEIPVKRKIKSHDLFKISRMKEVIKPTVPHKHDQYFEIIILSQGAGFHQIDTQCFEVSPPCLFVLHPGQVHCWEFTEAPKGYVIMFRIDFLMLYMDEKDIQKHLEIIPYISLDEETSIEIQHVCQKIEHEFCSHKSRSQNIIYHYLLILFHLIRRHRIESSISFIHPSFNLIVQFKDLVEKHFMHKHLVKDYAGLLSVSPKYLNQVCQEVLKQSASSVIANRLMLESKRLLLHTNKQISEIAFSLNFSDPSYFVKFFKKKAHLVPKEFRNMLDQ